MWTYWFLNVSVLNISFEDKHVFFEQYICGCYADSIQITIATT